MPPLRPLAQLLEYWKVVARATLDRRPTRGAEEFHFRPCAGDGRFFRIDVAARAGGFRARPRLRRGSSDLDVFHQIFANNDYNLRRFRRWRDIRQAYQAILERGEIPLILDLGANIGLSALYFAKSWPEAQVLALEPEEDNWKLLQLNCAELPRVQPVRAAIGCADGLAAISTPGGPAFGHQTVRSETGGIPVMSIRTALAQAPAGRAHRPFLVKIDIEGFERDLFAQDTGWIDEFPVLILEPHDWMMPKQGTAAPFLRAIAARERDFCISGENIFSFAREMERR